MAVKKASKKAVKKISKPVKIKEKKKKVGRPKNRSRAGRKPLIDQNILNKLEQAFSMGCPDTEACLFAGISTTTLYNFQKQNPEFVERKATLKETPALRARQCVVSRVSVDPEMAFKYLERKKSSEFGPKQIAGSVSNVQINIGLTRQEEEIKDIEAVQEDDGKVRLSIN